MRRERLDPPRFHIRGASNNSVAFNRAITAKAARTDMNPKTRMAINLMKTKLHRKLTLSELAKSVNLSLSHFSHVFKADTGMSPGRYLIRLRLEKARKLLGRARVRVKEAMFDSGFGDKGNFGRSFKDAFGETPSEYRKGVLMRKAQRRQKLDP